LNPEDARRTFEALSETLEKAGLGWMLSQVRQEIAFGRAVTKTLSVVPEDFGVVERQRRQRVRFVSAQEYTSQQQLALLVDAIEQTVVGSIEMQNSVLDAAKLPVVHFFSDDGQHEQHSFTHDDVRANKSSTEGLKAACDKLRRELLEDANGF